MRTCTAVRRDWAEWDRTGRIRRSVYSWAKSFRSVWGILGWFCQNGFYWPVLKHGPRSLPIMRVWGCKNLNAYRKEVQDVRCQSCNIDHYGTFGSDMSKSIIGRTRKMVNYTWVGWSQGKLWWRLVALLTCKSFVKLACRGERLIELSSSWFPLKFLSGKLEQFMQFYQVKLMIRGIGVLWALTSSQTLNW